MRIRQSRKDFPTIYAVDGGSVGEFREKWGDGSEIVIISRGSEEDRRLSREFAERVGYRVHDLKLGRLR